MDGGVAFDNDDEEEQQLPIEEAQLNAFADTDRIGCALYTVNPELFSSLMPYFQLSHPPAKNLIELFDRTNMSDHQKLQLMLTNANDYDDDGWA